MNKKLNLNSGFKSIKERLLGLGFSFEDDCPLKEIALSDYYNLSDKEQERKIIEIAKESAIQLKNSGLIELIGNLK